MAVKEKSKFYIAVDCEGVACVAGTPGKGLSAGKNYEFAAIQATKEANAAACALFEHGADEVWVWDNHCTGINLDYDQLDSRCKIVLGSGNKTRFPGIDKSFSGVLFVGYHAREGTKNAVLAHTYSSEAFQGYEINGKSVGELEIDAAFAGLHGVPVIFVSSDSVCVAQAKESFPWIKTVETKTSLTWNSAISLHPKASCAVIFTEVLRAAEEIADMMCFSFHEPINLSIRFKRLDAAASATLFGKDGKPFILTDGFTRQGVLDSIKDIFL